MGIGDKIGNAADQAVGKAKQAAGQAADDASLKADGAAQQAKGDAGQRVEQAKDAAYDKEHKEDPRIDDVN